MDTRLARGQRVGGRYRLERELGRGNSITWEATDERLDRAVALRVFGADIDRRVLVKRAGAAASLTHPRVVRVFDTGQDGDRFFTVSELLPAALSTVRLPLATDQAVSTAIDIAEALAYAHERGVIHGNLHEGNVLLSEGGAKVGDFALAGQVGSAQRTDDLRSFGELMRRTGPRSDTAVPTGFARVVEGLANGTYASAGEALADLRALRPAPATARRRPSRRAWLIVGVVVLLAIALFGITRLGGRSPGTEFAPGGRIEGTPLNIGGVSDYDPLGDNREGPGTVAKIIDNDPSTFWSTEAYKDGPDFSGLKAGVGVIFDMGDVTEVGRAQFSFPTAGCSFELRYSDSPSRDPDDWTIAATVADSPLAAPIIFNGAQSRYWLLWVTQLTEGVPGIGSAKYGCAVSEVDLFAP